MIHENFRLAIRAAIYSYTVIIIFDKKREKIREDRIGALLRKTRLSSRKAIDYEELIEHLEAQNFDHFKTREQR